jgi:hypothetical protein
MASMVQSLPVIVFLFIFGIFAAMAGMCVFAAVRSRARAGLIAATPTSHVGFATDGYVEIEGVAHPINGLTLKAPLTGTACLWYNARLERWSSSSSESEHAWRVVRQSTSDSPFLLRDSSGTCIVFPLGAEVTFTDKSVWFGATPVPVDKNPSRKGPGESPEGNVRVYGTADKEYRYTEERIYPGDPLYALGQFYTAGWDEEEENVEEEEEEDAPTDAENTDEWDDIDRFDELTRQASKITSRHLSKPPDKPYLLSTTPQAKLLEVHSQGWKGALFVGVVPAAIALLVLYLRFA